MLCVQRTEQLMWCAKCGMIADYNQAIREGTVPCNHIWKTGSLDGGIVHHKTFDGKPDRVGEMNANRALAYEELTTHILKRYAELFPNYAWSDTTAAVDLMAAEIATLREELKQERNVPTDWAIKHKTIGNIVELSTPGHCLQWVKAFPGIYELIVRNAVGPWRDPGILIPCPERLCDGGVVFDNDSGKLLKCGTCDGTGIMAYEITAQRSYIAESKLETNVAATQRVDVSGASATMQAGGEPRRGQDLPDATTTKESR